MIARRANVLPIVAALFVVAVLAGSAGTGRNAAADRIAAADQNYNRLARSWSEGRLDLGVAIPEGLKRLPDPYDPAQNAAFRSRPYWLHDTSYFGGKAYLYFGAAPTLLLFAPWAAITESYLRHSWGVAIFCAVTFLAGSWLLSDVRRRYFPNTGQPVLATLVVTLGFATGAPILMQRADVWEAAITCGQALVMLSLLAVWRASREKRKGRWLALASLTYGLALAARPSLAFGGLILVGPVCQNWIESRSAVRHRWLRLSAALIPIALCVGALLLYNQLRFGRPWEFGQTYQLSGERQSDVRHFSIRYVWTNVRVYFLQPAQWSTGFPFVEPSRSPVLPAGHGLVEDCFGAALNLPFLWFAVASPWALRWRSGGSPTPLRLLVPALGWLFASSSVVLCLYFGCTLRYEFEILSPLALLAAVGALALEDRFRERRRARLVFRSLGAALAGLTILFVAFAAIQLHARQLDDLAEMRLADRHFSAAAATFEEVLRWHAGDPEASNQLSLKSFAEQHPADGLKRLQRSLELNPANPWLENAYGLALAHLGWHVESVTHFAEAVRLDPNLTAAECNLVTALAASGHKDQALAEVDRALRRDPDNKFLTATKASLK